MVHASRSRPRRAAVLVVGGRPERPAGADNFERLRRVQAEAARLRDALAVLPPMGLAVIGSAAPSLAAAQERPRAETFVRAPVRLADTY